jgi:hypothetical protein
MDFMNMLERERLESKKISKTQSVTSRSRTRWSSRDVHIGPSDHVPWLDDRKWAYVRLEGRLRRRAAEPGVQARGLGLAELGRRHHRRGPRREDRQGPRHRRPDPVGVVLLHEVAAGAVLRRRSGPGGSSSDALVVLLGAALYLLAGLSSLRMPSGLLGPDPAALQPHVGAALVSTARGLMAGLRHLLDRRDPTLALTAMTLMRFCYGALTVTVLMLCRYAWADTESGGLALLGVAVGVSGAGFFAAAVITPWAVARLSSLDASRPDGQLHWVMVCAATAAVLEPGLGLPFEPAPMLIAAFVLGLITQGAKIATDTVVQSAIADDFRGRIFSLYDVLFNVAFVGAAGVAALMLPPDGASAALVTGVALLYAATAALLMFHVKHAPRKRTGAGADVSRET